MSDQSAPSPATQQPMPAGAQPEQWKPPTTDQEFVFESVASAPSWIDKGWASFDRGPALAVPATDILGKPPYNTKIARVGDTVYFKAATASKPAHFEVIPGEPKAGEGGTLKIPAVTNASLEDMLRTGVMTPDELGTDAKAQVAARSPELKALAEEGEGAPAAIAVTELVKTS